MSAIGTWLVSLAGPAAKTVLKSLGFGFVTYAALSMALASALTAAKAAWGGLGGDVLGLIELAGASQAMAIIAGGMVARVAMLSAKKLQLLA